MAEIEQNRGKKDKNVRQKKINIHIDFTPMVDMNMLLITFFMLCTSLSKPQTMEISMPTKDRVEEAEQTKVKESNAITLILDEENRVYYYLGMPNYEDPTTLKISSYDAQGIRSLLLNRNAKVVAEMNALKQEKLNSKISQKEFEERAAKIKSDKSAPVVMIKATAKSTYMNLIDALDEMHICNISKYAIVDLAAGDEFLLSNITP